MSDRVSALAAVTAATLIVGGSLYVLLRQGAGIVAEAPPPALAAPAAVPMPSVKVSPGTSAPAGAIYRCDVGGSVVYSDAPCKGGRMVEVQHTQGWEAPRPSAQRHSVEVAEVRTVASTAASTSEKSRAAECALIEQQIAQIDSAARVGGTIPYMEDLKERRRKLVDRKYELRC